MTLFQEHHELQFAGTSPVAVYFPTSDSGFSWAARWDELREQEEPISCHSSPHCLRESGPGGFCLALCSIQGLTMLVPCTRERKDLFSLITQCRCSSSIAIKLSVVQPYNYFFFSWKCYFSFQSRLIWISVLSLYIYCDGKFRTSVCET